MFVQSVIILRYFQIILRVKERILQVEEVVMADFQEEEVVLTMEREDWGS